MELFFFISLLGLFTERKVEEDINTCNGSLVISDPGGFTHMIQSLVGRSCRVAQVAERIVDGHDDPLFRNGLMVYITQLRKGEQDKDYEKQNQRYLYLKVLGPLIS